MKARQTGISLVEIMIALTISTVLMAGIIQVFASTKRTYRVQEAMSRLQESGRFALDVLTRDIRAADFWGCVSGSSSAIGNLLDTTSDAYDEDAHVFDQGLDGTDGTEDTNSALNEPDMITLASAYGSGISVQPPYMPTTSSNLKVIADSDLKENQIVFISDCLQGDIFQITNDPSTGNGSDDQVNHNTGTVSKGPGNATGDLSKTYEGDAQIFATQYIEFFIQENTAGEPGLYRRVGTENAQEMVDGVENMQILYGEDTDDDKVANYYVSATNVSDMDNVVSVRVSLLLRSIDNNLLAQPQSYTFNGDTATATDLRIRRVMTTTIAIRNRQI